MRRIISFIIAFLFASTVLGQTPEPVFGQDGPSNKVSLDKFLENIEMHYSLSGEPLFRSNGTPLDQIPAVSVPAGRLRITKFEVSSGPISSGLYRAETNYSRRVFVITWDGPIEQLVSVNIVLLCKVGLESCHEALATTLKGESFGVVPMFFGASDRGELNLNLLYILN